MGVQVNAVGTFVKRNNLDLQFWGYEGGNLLATIAGAGGFERFIAETGGVLANAELGVVGKILALSRNYPDGFVTITLGIVILAVPGLQHLANRHCGTIANNLCGSAIVLLSVTILVFALSSDTSWITASAASFVVASGFLRQSRDNPFLFKTGGLALAFGGFALAAFGIEEIRSDLGASHAVSIGLSVITTATGLYVVAASLLTYQGGIFETARYRAGRQYNDPAIGWVGGLIHPTKGILPVLFELLLDRPITWINANIVDPAIFWVPGGTKEQKPLATSMWARLPWRIAAIGLALTSGTQQGMAFALANTGWAVGDVSIGSLDWED